MAAAAILASQWHATVNAGTIKAKTLSVEILALRNETGKIVALILFHIRRNAAHLSIR